MKCLDTVGLAFSEIVVLLEVASLAYTNLFIGTVCTFTYRAYKALAEGLDESFSIIKCLSRYDLILPLS